MAQDLFRAEVGLADDNIHYLSGAGAPPGTGLALAAPVGSKWSDTSTGTTYTKTGASTWAALATGGDAAALQGEVDAIETAVGLNANGTRTWTGTPENFLNTDSVMGAVSKIDLAVTVTEGVASGAASNLAAHILAQTTLDGNQDTAISARVLKAGDTMTGNLAFGGTKLPTGLLGPTDPTDAANKAYVDSVAAGLTWLNDIVLINFTGSASAPVATPVLYDSYVIDTGGATGDWAAFAVGDVVQCTNETGPVWTKVTTIEIGQSYIISGVTETTPVGFAATHMTDLVTITNATPGAYAATFVDPVVGNATFISDPQAALFGRSYTYVLDSNSPTGNPTHNWVQFGGPGSTGAGVGLYYTGNTLHIGLGAGVAQLPSDEVGLDVRANSGLFLTQDGTTASTDTAAKLAIKLDGATLSAGVNGLRLSTALATEISNATTNIGNEVTRATNAEGLIAGNVSTLTTRMNNARTETQVLASTSADMGGVLVDNVEAVKWIVSVRGTGANAALKTIVEVLAVHNGTPSADASQVDYTVYAKLKIGTLVGLTFVVDVTGVGAAQAMNLTVSATSAIDVAAIRESVFF